MSIAWAKLVFSADWMRQLDQRAFHRFSQQGLAEEASTYVIEKLSEDNWARLEVYSGQSKPNTFLHTVCGNLLEEFARKRFGRPRPPTWLTRQGVLWVNVWKRLCLERQPEQSLIDQITANQGPDVPEVVAIIGTVRAKMPWCGHSPREIPTEYLGHEPELNSSLLTTTPLDNDISRQELEEHMLVLSSLLENLNCPSITKSELPAALCQAVTILKDSIQLTAEEVILLKLAYQESLSMKAIAQAMGMPSHQPGRRLAALFKRMQTALEQQGWSYGGDGGGFEELY